VATSPVKTEIFKYPRTNRFGTVYSDTPATGIKRNLITDDVGKLIIEEYKKGASTVKLADKYKFSKDTINRYIKENAPGVLRTASQGINQYGFDPSVIDEIKEDAKTMSRKEILKKYEGKISKKRLDKEKLTFGKVEEAGRPRIPEGEKSLKAKKRQNRIFNSQGFQISGTADMNFHHIFPIGGLAELSPKDTMLLSKKFNERLGGFNLQLNDIADEIADLDFSKKGAVEKLNELNAKSASLVDRGKAKLPTSLKNAIGYIRYEPVYDENGTVLRLQQIKEGVDDTSRTFADLGDKKYKDYSPEERKNIKRIVKARAKNFEKLLLEKAENLSEADKLKVCNFLANGGLPGDCKRALTQDPEKASNIIANMDADSPRLNNLKNTAKTLDGLLKSGAVIKASELPRPDDAILKDTFKETNIRWNNDIGAFVTPNEDIASQADIKKYAADNPIEVKAGETPLKPATNKSVLANVGRTMAAVGAPLPTALIDSYFIGQQVKQGKGTAEIASNPLNWLGLATMEPLTKAAGIAEGDGLKKVLRLGLNPATIRGITRFAGLPGLAISTAMTAYDQYEKYKDGEGFIYKLFNKEGT
tara:strand:- start:350 stop:2116 length:1767 start_codon:yes stop_codon:yes gene_type:complete